MNRLKARIMVIVAAALVGAVSVPFAVANKGADDPAGHVRHAKKHDKKAAAARRRAGRARRPRRVRRATPARRPRAARPSRVTIAASRPSRVTTGVRYAQAEAGDDRGGHGNDDGSGHN